MDKTRLERALAQLIEEGSLSAEQGSLVSTTYDSLDSHRQSRKSIAAEIAGYLGGAFIFLSVAFFTAKEWSSFPGFVRTSLFGILSIILMVVAHSIGTRSALRQRLAAVLAMGSAISATGAVAVWQELADVPFIPFLCGAVIASIAFYRNRHEILHLGSYGFLFLTSIMSARYLLDQNDNGGPHWGVSLILTSLSSVWIFLSYRNQIQKILGYLASVATYFIAVQFLFISNHRVFSYALAIILVALLARLFMQERSWPLLIGAVAITTFTTGEFIAATLGGSLGALLGLFTAGIALITSSLLALRAGLEHEA
jgi:hypothetical protein